MNDEAYMKEREQFYKDIENEYDQRGKELQKFSNKCKDKSSEQLISMINIYGEDLADPENREHFKAFLFHLSCGKGKKGIPVYKGKGDGFNEWRNGGFGSRWLDFECFGIVRRYAYYEAGSVEGVELSYGKCDRTLPMIYQM
tara:strand:- start:61 stop:486 length:426 start_codon:yes stop_codon:yes gene_type:complete